MGQKTNPIGNRLGIIRGWDSNWYGGNDYDKPCRGSQNQKVYPCSFIKSYVIKVIIERTLKLVTVTITTARPGIIIGKVDKR
jgi:small subunit ribosomal protein S3